MSLLADKKVNLGQMKPLFLVGLGVILLILRLIFPAYLIENKPYEIAFNAFFTFFLAGLILILAAGCGAAILKLFKCNLKPGFEQIVIPIALGLGVLGYGVYFLGLLGWLKPAYLIAWMAIVFILSYREYDSILNGIPVTFRKGIQTWKAMGIIPKVLSGLGILILFFTFLQALMPPIDYDGLAYHLQVPKLFLEAGRIYPDYNNWFSFYPSTYEMLYMLGLSFGSDIFAKLIHFSTFILLIYATYGYGQRILSNKGGWIAAAILMGIPVLPLWASSAYTDVAWALYQFLAVGLFLTWVEEKRTSSLVLAGVMQGLALGSKYLAFSGAWILGLLVLAETWKSTPRQVKLKQLIRNGVLFGGTALLVVSPWLIKNLVWTGDPLFPLLLTPRLVDPERIRLWRDYLAGFGTGKQWFDYLLLPVNIYLHYQFFGTFFGSIDIPNPLFILVFLFPFLYRKNKTSSYWQLMVLLLFSVAQFVIWSFGSQQTRFLLPIYPVLSILAAFILLRISQRYIKKNIGEIAGWAMISAMVVITLIVSMKAFSIIEPINLLSGNISKDQYLKKMLNDYSAFEYIHKEMPSSSKILLLWDGRGYYCGQSCIADVDQVGWTTLVSEDSDNGNLVKYLAENKITHILYSKNDADFFTIGHDSLGIHKNAEESLLNKFIPICGKLIYKDSSSSLFEITYEKSTCN
jgi:4-amino-4-deoxy-L-arabinose transferase-like glycosyltransferase